MERVHPKNGAMPPAVLVHKHVAIQMEIVTMLCTRLRSSTFDGLQLCENEESV